MSSLEWPCYIVTISFLATSFSEYFVHWQEFPFSEYLETMISESDTYFLGSWSYIIKLEKTLNLQLGRDQFWWLFIMAIDFVSAES